MQSWFTSLNNPSATYMLGGVAQNRGGGLTRGYNIYPVQWFWGQHAVRNEVCNEDKNIVEESKQGHGKKDQCIMTKL